MPGLQLHPSLGMPLQFESSPATLQSSLAAGATAPVHADQVPSAWQVCPPTVHLPFGSVGISPGSAAPSGVSQQSCWVPVPIQAFHSSLTESQVRVPQSPHGSVVPATHTPVGDGGVVPAVPAAELVVVPPRALPAP